MTEEDQERVFQSGIEKSIRRDQSPQLHQALQQPPKAQHPNACAYKDCIMVESMLLEQVIKVKRRMSRLDEKAKKELEKRLKVSYGDAAKDQKPVTKMSPASTPSPSSMQVQRQRR